MWYGAGAAIALAGAAGGLAASGSAVRTEPHAAEVNATALRNRDIEFYRARTARDPRSARDFTQLAGLYLQRARETADNEDLVRAEDRARRSLALRRGRNDEAVGVLASSLMGQHRFSEAHRTALELLEADSGSIAARGLVAESAMELGRYREADSLFGMLAGYQTDLGTAPRLARWAELRGRTTEARRLLRQALTAARRRHGLPAEQLAWFHLRLGDLALRTGHLAEAGRELDAGLAIRPGDYRLLGARARLAAARHQWQRAAADGELAVSQALDPATLGLLADVWQALGDSVKSAGYDRAMRLTVLRQPGAYHRAWSLYLLDHGRDVPRVLANVRQELTARQDIYGYDLLAWALHAAGRDREARRPMASALALGTADAMLAYHAGMIARALDDSAEARTQLRRALAINPWWHPTQPATARAVLDTLAR
jgi:tetratricopeptide (TPR) repeat protein